MTHDVFNMIRLLIIQTHLSEQDNQLVLGELGALKPPLDIIGHTDCELPASWQCQWWCCLLVRQATLEWR